MRKIFVLLTLILCSTHAWAQEIEFYEADILPWSGYWWPSSLGGMYTGVGYQGKPAVLDKLAGISTQNSGAVTQWYLDKFYKPSGESWFGLCHAVALAAITEPEPVAGGVYKDVPLGVGDKKALLTLAHSHDVISHAAGYNPLILHQWIVRYLRDEKKPFIANLGLNNEVWYYPVYGARVEKTDFIDRTDFRVALYYVTNDVHPDFVGTKTSYNYQTYTLFKDSAGIYTHGQWTGDSRTAYPVGLWISLERQGPPGFDMDAVLAAVQSNTDDLDKDLLYPGSYNGFFQDIWGRQLNALAGDWLEISFDLANRQVAVLVTIYDGLTSLTETITWDNPRLVFQTKKDQPWLRIEAEERLHNSPFVLEYNLAHQPLAIMSRRDGQFSWVGWAGIVQDDVPGEVLLTSRGQNGRALRSMVLPKIDGQKFSQAADIWDFDSWALGRAETMEITYPGQISVLGLSASTRGLTALPPAPTHGQYVVPGSLGVHGRANAFYVRNQEPRSVSGTIHGWDHVRKQPWSQTLDLQAHEVRYFSWGTAPLPNNPSPVGIDFGLERVSLEACFVGSQSMEMIPGSQALSQEFYLSHYPQDSTWSTNLYVLNPGSENVEIRAQTLSGRIVATEFVPAQTTLEISMASWPQMGESIKLTSTAEVDMYVGYQSPQDWAMVPVTRAQDAQTEQIIPHVPGTPWWTGAIIDRVQPGPCTLVLDYYSGDGTVVHSQQLRLNSYEPYVFSAYFEPGVEYLKITSDGAKFATRVLYGTDDFKEVAGAVF